MTDRFSMELEAEEDGCYSQRWRWNCSSWKSSVYPGEKGLSNHAGGFICGSTSSCNPAAASWMKIRVMILWLSLYRRRSCWLCGSYKAAQLGKDCLGWEAELGGTANRGWPSLLKHLRNAENHWKRGHAANRGITKLHSRHGQGSGEQKIKVVNTACWRCCWPSSQLWRRCS